MVINEKTFGKLAKKDVAGIIADYRNKTQPVKEKP
jgi:hypothetical protein